MAAFVFTWSIYQHHLIVAKFTFGVIFILSIVNLIIYVNQTNRKTANILKTFKNLDSIPDEKKGESFDQLKGSIDGIISTIKEVNIDKEVEHQYFEQTLGKIDTAVISYDATGTITLFNKAAEAMLGVANPTSIISLTDKRNELSPLFNITGENKPVKIVIQKESRVIKALGQNSLITLNGRGIRIVTLTDITNQLTDEEIASYSKLIRVMTHEIMNSVSPLKSLLNTLTQLYSKDGKRISPSEVTATDIDNTLLALNAMHKRTLGLLQFVDSYRKLTKIPQPIKQSVYAKDLLDGIATLKQPDAYTKGIEISTAIVPSGLMVDIDEGLMNQVLINLVTNAIESTGNGGKINLSASINRSGLAEIRVDDNGSGIEPDLLDKVFTPFFTTKKEGSGIGLSLSREVIRLHGGGIDLISSPQSGTTVIIQLPR